MVYTPGGSPKTNKDIVYTPMVGLPTIRVTVYAYFGGSPILNKHQTVSKKNFNLLLVVSFVDISYDSKR